MNPWMGKKIAVVMGGISHEKEVSVRTGTGIATALKERGHTVVPLTVADDALAQIQATKPDVVFIALHGRFGEDGTIQGALEMMHIPYTGSDVCASAVAMNKLMTKQMARMVGVTTPKEETFTVRPELVEGQRGGSTGSPRTGQYIADFVAHHTLRYPLIVKPNREGSTVGMSIVKDDVTLTKALQDAATLDSTVLVEEFVEGTEVTVGILCGETLTPLEIVPKSGFYDYASKYTKGATDYICPARISDAIAVKVQEDTKRVYDVLGCQGVARADYIIDASGTPYFLEINTIPGMTETSLVPKAAAHKGISYGDVCERVLADAHCEKVR